MLKFQVVLIAVLIGCIAFVACERTKEVLDPGMMDAGMMDAGMMDAYKSWPDQKMLDGPWLDFKGDAHDLGSRTIYLNEAAAMANKTSAEEYPIGSMIVKVSMDTTNTFVSQISTMTKTDGTDNSGWVYGVTGPPSATAVDMMMRNTLTSEMAAGACVDCHANASNDFVFVPLIEEDESPPVFDSTAHKSWKFVGLPEPVGTGAAHGMGSRIVYINETGVTANREGGVYPVGTMIVKEIMDATNSFVMTVATMEKTDDMTYNGHNGWKYDQYMLNSETNEFELSQGGSFATSQGCHDCHVKDAGENGDSVIVKLSIGE
jgi:hypothetical protein